MPGQKGYTQLGELYRQRNYSTINENPAADTPFDPPYDAVRIHSSVDGDLVFENEDGEEQTLSQAVLSTGEFFPVEVAKIVSGSTTQTLANVVLFRA